MGHNRCKACRRPLTNPISLKHGLGPDCLRRAVKNGTAPLEALNALTQWQRTKNKAKSANRRTPPEIKDTATLDLFEEEKRLSIERLMSAVAECETIGLRISITIEES